MRYRRLLDLTDSIVIPSFSHSARLAERIQLIPLDGPSHDADPLNTRDLACSQANLQIYSRMESVL
jgi:hypothetical protein